MSSTVSVNVSPNTLLDLMQHLRATNVDLDPSCAVDEAIRYWLAAAKGEPVVSGLKTPRGYRWKSLFLPEGTFVCMTYYGDNEYAVVEGDHLMYQGQQTSPNQFACGQAGSVRNAWYDLSIRLPGEKRWQRPFKLRREQERAATASQLPQSITEVHAAAAAPADAPPIAPRDCTPGTGWTEPERRKFRFRLEDVAFD